MHEIIFENKDKASIAFLDFNQAIDLKSTLQKKLLENGFNLDNLEKDFLHVDLTMATINKFFNAFLCIDSSSDFFNICMKCLERCLYNDEKITERTFERIEARENYYQLIGELIKINLSPFVKGLALKFSKIIDQMPKLEVPE